MRLTGQDKLNETLHQQESDSLWAMRVNDSRNGSRLDYIGPTTTAIKTSAELVTETRAQVLTSPLANRKQVTIQNEGSYDVYVGDATVTIANGLKISRNSSATYAWGENIEIYMVSYSGSQDVRFLEES